MEICEFGKPVKRQDALVAHAFDELRGVEFVSKAVAQSRVRTGHPRATFHVWKQISRTPELGSC